MQNNYTILVNSSDGFEDCWFPFFSLFKKYWPNYNGEVYLNTEFKEYVHDGISIKSTKANSNNIESKLSWSECLIIALNQINTPYVLYLQEDYFINKVVDNEIINEFVEKMINDENIKYLGLTNFGNYPPFMNYDEDIRLKEVSKNSRYRISTQAGLWRKETLLSYLRKEENGWMFEIYGTWRASRRNELFLTLNNEIYIDNNNIINYVHTGIIKGKWHEAMPYIFKINGLKMDFDKRGFYKEKNVLMRKIETFRKLLKYPNILIKNFFNINNND